MNLTLPGASANASETDFLMLALLGVGLMGLQIAKLMGAAKVIGSSTNPERRARLKEFGADLAVDSKDPTWHEALSTRTEEGAAPGQVSVDSSQVRVEIDLPFLLRAIKGTIEGKVNDKLDQLLGK